MMDLTKLVYKSSQIKSKRVDVAKRLTNTSCNMKGKSITKISVLDLKLLFDLYDEIFFNNKFKKELNAELRFSLSKRMTKSAGKTLYLRNEDKNKSSQMAIEIRMGTEFFFKYNEIENDKKVCGITTNSALEAFLIVFEHEICHVIEFNKYQTSNCKKERFKSIAKNVFAHTESYHKLPTQRQIAQQKYGLRIGDSVSFEYENKKIKGILYNINKRATIMVRDKNGVFVDNHGNRYSKYYVPITFLK